MTERDEASISVVRAHQPRSWFGEDSHRAALSHLRLLLHIEPDPLHLGQYDFRRKQPVAHRIGRDELVNAHRVVDGQLAVRLAHQPSEIPADPKPLAEVARDRTKVRAASTANLDARNRSRPGLEVNEGCSVNLHLACCGSRQLATSSQHVGAFAVDLDR